jgi:hypothetical protein
MARTLRSLNLEDSVLGNTFNFPPSLECLFLNNTEIHPSHASLAFGPGTNGADSLANLKVLEVRSVFADLDRLVKMLERSANITLTKLDILNSSFQLSHMTTLLESGKLSKLKYLSASLVEMDDDYMGRIAAGCPLLEEVELWAMKVTGVGVKELCLRTALKTLKVADCLKISTDALEWARARGIKVSISHAREDRRPFGRRVRYV